MSDSIFRPANMHGLSETGKRQSVLRPAHTQANKAQVGQPREILNDKTDTFFVGSFRWYAHSIKLGNCMSQSEHLERLGKRSILLSALPQKDWDALLELGRPVTFAKGGSILMHGSAGQEMYLILEGRVEVSVISAEGTKGVLNQMGPGEILGEIALLDGGERSADAVAASDFVSLIAIERKTVMRVLKQSPDMVFAVIAELCRRVRNASEMFEVKSEKQARVRLARSLLRLAAKWGEDVDTGSDSRMLRGFSQSELGDYAGLARENVNRCLKAFECEDLISRREEGLVLLDLEEIAEVAQL